MQELKKLALTLWISMNRAHKDKVNHQYAFRVVSLRRIAMLSYKGSRPVHSRDRVSCLTGEIPGSMVS
jgi:hypothetical protein